MAAEDSRSLRMINVTTQDAHRVIARALCGEILPLKADQEPCEECERRAALAVAALTATDSTGGTDGTR